MQIAKSKLTVISVSTQAKKSLESQIDSLSKNTVDKIAHIPDFKVLKDIEDSLPSDHPETPKLLEVIRLIKEAFSVQRFKHQTKPIQETERFNFAKLLNSRIDPIDVTGVRAKTKSSDQTKKKYQLFEKILSQLGGNILNMLDDVCELLSRRLNAEFVQNLNVDSTANKLYEALLARTKGILVPNNLDHEKNPSLKELEKKVMSTIRGGLENAISLHLAFIKVAFKILTKRIPNPKRFKQAWNDVLKNLSHISKQFSAVQAFTLKLVENLNGVQSNQRDIYDFNPENFELVYDYNDQLILLPTIDFLQKVIALANDNSTIVQSNNTDYNTVNFAEIYGPIHGCPIYSARIQSNWQQYELGTEYFKEMDLLTQSVFGFADK